MMRGLVILRVEKAGFFFPLDRLYSKQSGERGRKAGLE